MSREKQNLLSAILKINRLDTSKKDKLIETNSLLLKIKKNCVYCHDRTEYFSDAYEDASSTMRVI